MFLGHFGVGFGAKSARTKISLGTLFLAAQPHRPPLADAPPPGRRAAHYLRRLDEFSQKFADFFTPQDFRAVFSADDLFPFDPRGISLLISERLLEEPSTQEDTPPSSFGIWHDE